MSMNASRVFDGPEPAFHVLVPTTNVSHKELRRLQGADVMRPKNLLLLLAFIFASFAAAAPSTVFAQTINYDSQVRRKASTSLPKRRWSTSRMLKWPRR